MKIVIREPIWKTQSIGIAEDKMVTHNLDIEISYKTQDGERLYPEPYTISRSKAILYPTQKIRNHIIHIIPIKDLRVMEKNLV